jgi:hypothetical protein
MVLQAHTKLPFHFRAEDYHIINQTMLISDARVGELHLIILLKYTENILEATIMLNDFLVDKYKG